MFRPNPKGKYPLGFGLKIIFWLNPKGNLPLGFGLEIIFGPNPKGILPLGFGLEIFRAESYRQFAFRIWLEYFWG